MSLLKDTEISQTYKKPGQAMSFRQQIRYVIEKSLEEKPNNIISATEEQIRDLEEYLQDEESRVFSN